MSSRRKAREAVLRALYICESRGISADEAFAEMAAVDREMENNTGEPDIASLKPFALGVAGEGLAYSRALARYIEVSREKLNGLIRPVLKNWELERIARIDRIILWIALAEMEGSCRMSEGSPTSGIQLAGAPTVSVPTAVIINEAIELARKYSSIKSPAFVNGVLDAIARNLGMIKTFS